MKHIFLVLLVLFSLVTYAQKNIPFYIINVAAVQSEAQAKTKASELLKSGYQSGYLWIPDYASLSGAKYFSVYIGPFSTQYECEVATEAYRRKNPDSYGLLVSQESKRVQITGIGKVVVTGNAVKEQSRKQKYIRGRYIEYLVGDVEHWVFKGQDGKEYDFMRNMDQSYQLNIDDAINPMYKNKIFEIYYETNLIDFGDPGPGLQKANVIQKLSLVK